MGHISLSLYLSISPSLSLHLSISISLSLCKMVLNFQKIKQKKKVRAANNVINV